MLYAAPAWLTDAALTAGALTTILSVIGIVGRWLTRFEIVRQFFRWVREGWREKQKDDLLRLLEEIKYELKPNGGRSFRDDVTSEFSKITSFMAESKSDRVSIHERIDDLTAQFHNEIARTAAAKAGVVDDRDTEEPE